MDVTNLCLGCMEETLAEGACGRCGWLAGQPAESPLYLPPGTILENHFVVGRVLGHGGFGITYLAWDMNLERRVALKEYLPTGVASRNTGTLAVNSYSGQHAGYELGLKKFIEEGRVLARFQGHPGMVAVQYFFQANGTGYLMMEYLEGVTLESFLNKNEGRISFPLALQVMMPVMDALREVHKTGILHRDVSPDNIYITHSGPVKLLDFGAARYALGQHSQNFSIILKEGYAPEEQYRSKGHQGPWTDVYACAATLYRAITGKVPATSLDRAHTDDLELPSTLGVAIGDAQQLALMKGLSVEAAGRYQSMEDFQAAMNAPALQGPKPLPIPPPPPGTIPGKQIALRTPTGRTRALVIGGLAFFVLLLVVVAVLHRPSAPPVSQPPKTGQPQQPPARPDSQPPSQPAQQDTPPSAPPETPPARVPAPEHQQHTPPRHQREEPPPQPADSPRATPASPPAGQGYQASVTQAEAAMRQNNPARAMELAQQAIEQEPNKPAAWGILGFSQLYGEHDAATARQSYMRALQLGGTAIFRVRHDQGDGTFSSATAGLLRISPAEVTFAAVNGSDSFRIAKRDLERADMNKSVATNFKRFLGRAAGNRDESNSFIRGAFHIKEMAHNYNLVGTSSDPAAEAAIILSLLNR
jgi:serine/threonine protein kinase